MTATLPPYWILTRERSGSTYLSHLLNGTNNFEPKFSEYLHFQMGKSKKNFIENSSEYKYCKINWKQLLFNNLSIEEICNALPDVKFIFLKREDLYARSISLSFCKQTGKWFMSDNVNDMKEFSCNKFAPTFKNGHSIPASYHNKKVTFDYNSTLKILQEMKETNYVWEDVLKDKDYLKVTYEDLIQNPSVALENILNYIGANCKRIEESIYNCKLKPMTRKESTVYINRLKKIDKIKDLKIL